MLLQGLRQQRAGRCGDHVSGVLRGQDGLDVDIVVLVAIFELLSLLLPAQELRGRSQEVLEGEEARLQVVVLGELTRDLARDWRDPRCLRNPTDYRIQPYKSRL